MSRNISLAPGEFYHLYNRGTEKRDIFSDRADYDRFLSLLYLFNTIDAVHIDTIPKPRGSTSRNFLESSLETDRGEDLVDICAYCLMPNHFHLLVQEKKEGGISRFMQKLMTGYTMYFNKRYEHSGGLFQGQFKASHVNEDRYLKYLISYIHLNPVKLIDPLWKENGIKNRHSAENYLRQYGYSSYPDYLGMSRIESKILNKKALPDYFSDTRDFKSDVTDWLEYNKS